MGSPKYGYGIGNEDSDAGPSPTPRLAPHSQPTELLGFAEQQLEIWGMRGWN